MRGKKGILMEGFVLYVYMLWVGLGKQSHHGVGGVKLGNAEQHPGFILYFILDKQ